MVMPTKKVSIICPIYNEEKFIAACVDCMLRQDYPQDSLEILLIDGGSTDRTLQILAPYVSLHSNIRLLENPKTLQTYALNTGIRHAGGEVIVRMDAHAVYPVNYVSTLVHYLYELPNAVNVGCVCHTQPQSSSLEAEAVAVASSHPFGVGNATYRTSVIDKPTVVDTVPFGCWKKVWFDKVGLFDEDLFRSEDDEFNARTIQNGGTVYLVPGISVTYYARESISKISKMFYQYGLFKPLANQKLKKPATLRQFVPLLFVLGISLGFLPGLLWRPLLYVWISGIVAYLLLSLFVSLKAACRKGRFGLLFILPYVFFRIHISYGIGYLEGIFRVLLHRSFMVSSNR